MESHVLEQVAEPCTNTAAIDKLDISSHIGPDIKLPWSYTQQTVDEQLSDVTRRFRDAKGKVPMPPTATTTTVACSMQKARHKRLSDRAVAKMAECAQEVKKVFLACNDTRFMEMASFLDLSAEELAVRHPNLNHLFSTPTGLQNAVLSNWISSFRASLDRQLTQLKTLFDPEMGEVQLARTFQWYQTHLTGPQGPPQKHTRPSSAGPTTPGFNMLRRESVAGKARPGSAFYVPLDRDAPESSLDDMAPQKTSEHAIENDDGKFSNRLAAVQLPPARERLRTFETKQIVGPLTARKLKSVCDDSQSPEPHPERCCTPSTATGCSIVPSASSARSTPTVSGPMSARSSPTPLGGSRPSTAKHQRPSTAQGQRSDDSALVRPPLSARPGTAPRMGARPPPMPMSARSSTSTPSKSSVDQFQHRGSSVPVVHHDEAMRREADTAREASEHDAAEHKAAVARQNMEDRWLMRRHRDIANQILEEERHEAVAVWAERRARVEEEIAHNAEAMRFQSELWQRGIALPSDAEEDIAATALADTSGLGSESGRSHSKQAGSWRLGSAGASGNVPYRTAPPKHDVSRITTEEPQSTSSVQVRFAPEAQSSKKSEIHRTETHNVHMDRVENLRYIHRHLLRASEAEDFDIDERGDDDLPMSIFETEVGAQHISLSAYTAGGANQAALIGRSADDSDVIAAVCDHWPAQREGSSGPNLHQLRFRQQQEAEAVKRVLARSVWLKGKDGKDGHWAQIPFNAAVVENALVMPSHYIKPDACVFNTEPNLKAEHLPGWMQDRNRIIKQRLRKPKRKLARRANSRRSMR